jgi:general secretion pathway protein D
LVQQGITPTPNVNTLPGAGLYSIAGSDFTATVRAIQEVGKVSILSRPVILARNNQQANILVGQLVPLITGVSFDALGNEHSSISYQQVGIILTVTPFITPDDMVEMMVAPQISEVAAQSTQISSGTNGNFSTPYINIRTANTVVVTPNGQTVVVGGLMQDSKTTTDSKIPVIGDIPLLGALFHHKIKADAKTELMIFLTPYIVRSPRDLVAVSQDERQRAEIPPKTFPEKEMNQYLSPTMQPGAAPPSKSASPRSN